MKNKGIIFDLDGTLLDTVEDLAFSVNKALKAHGYKTHETNMYYQFVGNGIKKMIQRASGEENIDDLLETFLSVYDKHFMDNTKPYEGIVELLEYCDSNNIKIGVCTNKKESYLFPMIKNYFKDITFIECVGDRFDGLHKPNPTYAIEIANAMNLKPEDIIFVGDSNVDMETAINANMTPIGVSWGFRSVEELKNAGAKYIINKPMELVKYLD